MAVSTVIAGGGDGTINEVATALMSLPADKRPCLGILPLGTANDFATGCNIPLQIENALQLAVKGRAVAIDLAQVNGEHYFINMATGVLVPELPPKHPINSKRPWAESLTLFMG